MFKKQPTNETSPGIFLLSLQEQPRMLEVVVETQPIPVQRAHGAMVPKSRSQAQSPSTGASNASKKLLPKVDEKATRDVVTPDREGVNRKDRK